MPLYRHKFSTSQSSAIPTGFTSNTSISGYVVDQSHGDGSYPTAWCVFNQNYTTNDYAWWTGNIGVSSSNPAWFSIEVPEAFVPSKIMIMNEIYSPQNFRDAQFQASKDGTNWTTLYTITSSPNTTGLKQTFSFDTGIAYKYFRMYFTASHASGVSVQAFQIFKKTSQLSGFDSIGRAVTYDSALDADRDRYPAKGLILYVPCETDITAAVGKQFTTTGSYTAKTAQGLPCLLFTSPCRTSIDTSVYDSKYTTLSCWFYCIKGSSTLSILGYGADTPYQAMCLQEASGQFTIERAVGRFSTGYNMTNNTWYHLAATLNNNVITAYVNGDPVKTFTWDMTLNLTGNVGIGGWLTGGYSPSGYITHCRIYNYPLSALEIKILSKELKPTA